MDSDRDDEILPRAQVAADDAGPVLGADLSHASCQILDPGQGRRRRQDKSDDNRHRARPHRRDISEVLGGGTRTDLPRARPVRGEVAPLDQNVRAHAVTGVRGDQHGAVITGADQLIAAGRQQGSESRQKILLGQVGNGDPTERVGVLSG